MRSYWTDHAGGSKYFTTCDPSSGGIGTRLNMKSARLI